MFMAVLEPILSFNTNKSMAFKKQIFTVYMYAPNNIRKIIDFLGSQQKNNFFMYHMEHSWYQQ
jgi:hypothetical protein